MKNYKFIKDNNPKVILISSDKNWIEGDALQQLKNTAEFEGMLLAVGLPDIHPGKGSPVGSSFITQGIFYPHLIENDAGCAVSLFNTSLKKNKLKIDKWLKNLSGLESQWDGNISELLETANIIPSVHDNSLGTIGGGNHFAELQVIENIYNQELFDSINLDKNQLMLLIHSGSRSVGEALYRSHTDTLGAKGLLTGSEEASQYLTKYNQAIKWAKLNRTLIAHRFIECLNGDYENILDICHNSITEIDFDGKKCWLHRKGAAPSDSGAVVIAGTRGTFSYIVQPIGDQKENAYSIAHGAGRKWKRNECKSRMKERYKSRDLIQTELGGHVICDDKDLLYEEAPEVYKKIEMIIDDLVEAQLIKVIASLKPVITYKKRIYDE
ncbi:MAG: RNA ligase RtcB family protein [Nitrospirae bacterium]|nr:RNA ligase RtcB family protein [Nitrospirota bacterium]